jgi:DNA processing protein
MNTITKLKSKDIPPQLFEIPQPPTKLYIRGKLPPKDAIYLAVVGSRKHTSYGKEICEKLIRGLAGYPIIIVSGLAIGIDSIAHKAALDANLRTVAFPGSGLSDKVLHPKSNTKLAQQIVDAGGCLISEHGAHVHATTFSFPERNRLMAGLCRAVLIIEAQEKSGTLITARMALDYNRDVLAVPGSALSSNSKGTNRLIRQGATPITDSYELLEALGFEIETPEQSDKYRYAGCSPEEKSILELLREPYERDALIRASGMDASDANVLLSIMEIKELIKEEYGEIKKT